MRLPVALTLLLLIALTLGGYYWAHKPVTPELALALGHTALNLGVAAGLTALAGGVGQLLLVRVFRQRDLVNPASTEAAERVFLAVALGWGALALVLWGLGLIGGWYGWVLWTGGLGALWFTRRALREWGRHLPHVRRVWDAPNFLARFALLVLGATLALGLLRALAPPLMWDALVYHLTLPKLYLAARGFALPTHQMSLFTGMPQLSEMLYLAAFALRGDVAHAPLAAQTFGWVFGLWAALGVAVYARHCQTPGALAPALLFAPFSLALALAWAYADLLMMVMALAMLLALRHWRLTGAAAWLVLAGLFAGLAWSGKYTGVIVPLGGGAAALWHLARGRPGRALFQWAILQNALIFCLCAVAAFAPWLIKNLIFTGNPLYPLLLPAGDMDALRQAFYTRPDLREANPLGWALIFFRAMFFGVQGANDYDVTLGPLFVINLLALLAAWRWAAPRLKDELRPLAVFAAAAYGGWIGLVALSPLGQQARLFFSALPALALLGAGGLAALEALNIPQLRLSRVIRPVGGLVLALHLLEFGAYFVAHNPVPYLLGQQTARDYAVANLGWYPVAMERINALPASARVKFVWEARALDCDPAGRCDPDVVIDRWWHARRALGDPPAILAAWKAQGFTHVLIYDTGADFARRDPNSLFASDDWLALGTLRQNLIRLEMFGGGYSLYEIP
jgi:hypothetical protein